MRIHTADPAGLRQPVVPLAEWVALAICLAASILLLGWALLGCRYGYEFTDEGYYLNWISSPWSYGGSVTQFGFVYYPLYKLVGGNIVLLRQANVLITYSLSCCLCIVWIRSLCSNWSALDPAQRAGFIGIAIALATSSLALFEIWLPTPNYNSLAFQSLVVATIGMLLAGRHLSATSIAGWTLIGIGGGFSFLAKPTTAAVLGCLIAGYVIVGKKFTLRGSLISLAVAILILVVAGLAIDGSVPAFARRFIKGLAMYNQLLPADKSLSVLRWDPFGLSRRQRTAFAVILALAFGSAAVSLLPRAAARLAAALVTALVAALSIAVIAGAGLPRAFHGAVTPIHFWAVSFGIGLAVTVFARGIYRQLSSRSLIFFIFLVLLPCSYALGTGNNFWTTASRAALFWVLAGFILYVELAAADGGWRKLYPATSVIVLITTVILYGAAESAYRQPAPLRSQTVAVEINRQSRLFLTDGTASYVQQLKKHASENGFQSGTPMIDLSGSSPGSLYLLCARSLGAAWLQAGYPGSNAFLATVLGQETCRSIAASWLLMEPGAKISFAPELLEPFGIDISRDYLEAGSVKSTTRGFEPTTFEHRLLKPARSIDEATLACEKARQADRPGPR